MRLIKNIYYTGVEDYNRALDLYLPDTDNFPIYINFHGGGLVHGSKEGDKNISTLLAEKGIAVATCNYRMYPAAKYPDFLLDASAAVAWVKKHISEYGGNDKIFIGGASAGGYISMMLCFDPLWLSSKGVKLSDIAGFIHGAGQPTTHFNVLNERGLDTKRVIIDNASPIFHIGNSAKYPPMLVLVSTNDMENRYEQTMLLMSTLKHFRRNETATLKVLEGTHCSYLTDCDEEGNNMFVRLASEYINSLI